VNGYLYGFNNSILTCLEFASGKMMWRDRSVGKGSLTYADGNLYIQSEDNVVGLAVASSAGYNEKGRFRIADQGLPSWAHPVVSGGRLYVRNQGTLAAYDIRTVNTASANSVGAKLECRDGLPVAHVQSCASQRGRGPREVVEN
jgi:outer membrane protein assembly factor BamB